MPALGLAIASHSRPAASTPYRCTPPCVPCHLLLQPARFFGGMGMGGGRRPGGVRVVFGGGFPGMGMGMGPGMSFGFGGMGGRGAGPRRAPPGASSHGLAAVCSTE